MATSGFKARGGGTLRELLITVAITLATAVLQIILKGISRTELPGKKHGLTREDGLFWTDWTIAAGLALATTLVVASSKKLPLPVTQVAFCLVAIVLGCSAFPFLLRLVAYESGAKIKEWGWLKMGWIFIANGVAGMILLSAVVVGVKVYG
ncbi:hypothetical protein [Actinomadura terrae]|uniref:hypothetical protein n=1 Tax=Actinomadura terrae TaxID=604353 RepID=UPI001FA7D8E7|nr:hypothetical protein [Actinomadura terrae]